MAKPVRALRAKATIAFPGGRFIRKGALVRSDDPAVKSHPEVFESVDDRLGIEQATANPGQKRAAAKPEVVAAAEVDEDPVAPVVDAE